MIATAREHHYEAIEVYTNAVAITPQLIECFQTHRVRVATSFYADDPAIHDAITQRKGSHQATIATLQRLIVADVPIRVGIIAMATNQRCVAQTSAFLQGLGIADVGVDHARSVWTRRNGLCHAIRCSGIVWVVLEFVRQPTRVRHSMHHGQRMDRRLNA